MINALRKNYGKTLWVTRLILAISILIGDLFSISTFFGLMSMMGLQMQSTLAGYIFYAIVSVAITEVLARFVIRFCFNTLRIYVIPYHEFVILFLLTLSCSKVLSGLIKLVYFITPVAAIFGEVIISFVTSAIAFFCLFLVVKKLYLNDKNAPFVFKWFAIFFLAFSAITAFFL